MSMNVANKTIELPSSITVRDLAKAINASPIEVMKTLMSNGVMANINQLIDYDTAAIVVAEMGYEATPIVVEVVTQEDQGEIPFWRRMIMNEPEGSLVRRPPVVTILGHVDHGKTTLLDAIRHTSVASGEAGGITQHIGAYQAKHNDRLITFLDTPGHAAFTSMRARGAQGADIVILVVAADDGVMPQTKEALSHAKAAKVPIIVAINKSDRPNANVPRVKQQLSELGLQPDDWDGDTIMVPVSAKEKRGLDDLLEAIILVADNTDIRANPNGKVIGSVIEAKRGQARGVQATMLLQNGSLQVGDVVIAGLAYGKIKAMFDYTGKPVRKVGPSSPVSIMGLNDVPTAGEIFQVVKDEKEARVIVTERINRDKQILESTRTAVTLEKLFDQFQAGKLRELRLVVKADVQGSIEPIVTSIEKLSTSDITIQVLHSGPGNISENDIMLASASKAIVVGFNVKMDEAARKMAESDGISVRIYNIIYRLLEDIEKALKGMLEPEERITELGKAEVRQIFRIKKIGIIAGSYVIEGELRRNASMRLVRKGQIIHEGPVGSLKRYEEDVPEVRRGFECGVSLRDYDDIQEGDVLECYIKEMVAAQ